MKKVVMLLFFVALGCRAHPHQWMDITVKPIINAQGEITAIDERWLFDPIYAQMLLQTILEAKTNAEQKTLWDALNHDVQQTLTAQHYYTFPHRLFGTPQNATLLNEQGQLYVHVLMPLLTPTKKLTYQIYEPTYYVEMLHSKEQPKHFAHGCQLQVIAANPSADQFNQASALDKNQKGDDDLGRFFADTGVITCP